MNDMERNTIKTTFFVRLPLPKGMGRLEAEKILKEHILGSGMWQGCKGVKVREAMYLTPEMEIHKAEQARRMSNAIVLAKTIEAENKIRKKEQAMLAELAGLI